MISRRLARFREYIVESNAQWLLITDSISARYISGFNSSNIALLCSDTKLYLFTDFRYGEVAEKRFKNSKWTVYVTSNIDREVAKHINNNDTVLVQSDRLSTDRYFNLQELMPKVNLIREGSNITSLFSIKTDSEIRYIENAAAIADKSYSEFLYKLSLGISESDAADLLDSICKRNGSEGPSFKTIMLFGERSSLPHGEPRADIYLNEGDLVLTDFGCTNNNFCSDMTRVAVAKNPSIEQEKLYNTVLKAQEAGKDAVAAGVLAKNVDKVVRDILADAGYIKEFGHGTGHGVGIRIHESPAINRNNDTVLEAGMVITVEPGLYIPRFGGVRIEDLLVVTNDGYRSLSNTKRELFKIA